MDGFATQKRPLTEVKEEPHERDCDYEIINTKEAMSEEHGESTSASQPWASDPLRDPG